MLGPPRAAWASWEVPWGPWGPPCETLGAPWAGGASGDTRLMGVVMPLCHLVSREEWPNSCNLNLYENGGHSVSWHADNERLFAGKFQDCPIISLSLGHERRFELKALAPDEDGQKAFSKLLLRDGDLCTMEGLFQKYYEHRVPREDKEVGPRINITWRWVVEHLDGCVLRGSEGRIMPYGGGKGSPMGVKAAKGKGFGKGKGKGPGGKGTGKAQHGPGPGRAPHGKGGKQSYINVSARLS
ncbi:unnamed protein product [Prorocentrum cordatum]|uniref:Fe2OG dioxygenase domain-containing protein n=1 Tax=Prorocentrum cordatum TaxID=2364126 RepID=A0ABN9Q4S6_9DINO|nr:unnamed protein product [Polarella glacialis]